MVLISSLRIQNQIHVRIFGIAELLNFAVPMPYADKKFFDVTARGIRAEGLVSHIEAQNPVVHKGPYLLRDIDATVAGAKLCRHQLPALCGRHARKQKHERHTADYGCE